MFSNETQKEDLRVLRTRKMLYDAFLELLSKKSFRSLTVGEITDQAMVNRATFYAHFADKYALSEYAIRENFRQLLEAQIPDDCGYTTQNLQIVIAAVCDFLNQLNGHCHLVEAQELPPFDEQITSMVREIITERFQFGDDPEPGVPVLVADIASWAIYGAALHWSNHRQPELAVEFAAQITPMINGILMGIPVL